MIARLWWKEARQAWPVWALLAGLGLGIQAVMGWYWAEDAGPAGYVRVALIFTMIYLFLIPAAVFAGERENGTLALLDAMPAPRPVVWTAKSSFAAVTTLALGLLLWAGARLFGVASPEWAKGGGVGLVWGLNGLGWGLLWSAIVGNALFAAVLAMGSLCVCLLTLVDLNQGPVTYQSTPALLILAALAAAGSGLIFHRDGPPKVTWGGRRRRPAKAPEATRPAAPSREAFDLIRPVRVWRSTVTRLEWQSLREIRANLGVLLAVVLIPWVAYLLDTNRFESQPIYVLCLSAAAMLSGVLAFHGENRGRTQRFLLQHGARPGVVWSVKVLTWWLATLVACVAVSLPILGTRYTPTNAPFLQTFYEMAKPGVLLTVGFAASALCGMVFRRGIMAGAIALVACLGIGSVFLGLASAMVLEFRHIPYVATGLLLVGWAWSGDWLFDRPGLGRWGRLALYLGGVTAALLSGYIADRVWSVPTLPPAQAAYLLQTPRVAGNVPDDQNAAPLYQEARRLMQVEPLPQLSGEDDAEVEAHRLSLSDVLSGRGDPEDPAVIDWLDRLEPALKLFREGARKPASRETPISRATIFGEPAVIWDPITAFQVSARSKLARGDLDGSWDEVETLLRMARQSSFESGGWSRSSSLEASALYQAMSWAASPKLTAGALERALKRFRDLPEPASKVDMVGLAALVFRNTLDKPRADLVDRLFTRWAGGRNDRNRIDMSVRLRYDVVTTPWEIARTRRVADLLAAARIQEIESRPFELIRYGPWRPRINMEVKEPGGAARWIPHEQLDQLANTTLLLQESEILGDLTWWDRSETARRAFDLMLQLRIWQARHGGKLPERLEELRSAEAPSEVSEERWHADRDLYSSRPFGYLKSDGQRLLPLGVFGPTHARPLDSSLEPTDGCYLLYSVGPNGQDDRARLNLTYDGYGDIIFPIRDDVPPPAEDDAP